MKKVFTIIGVVVASIIIVLGIILFIKNVSSNRIVCKSSSGNITIFYNDDELTGYTTTGKIYYDFDNQKAYASKIGVEAYMNQFDDWFVNNTNGKCTNKK